MTANLHTGSDNAGRSHRIILACVSLAVFVVTLLVYIAGLSDQFILDDAHNLSPIARYPELPLLERLWLYIGEQIAGPTGRPVAAVSFFLNGTDWPADATAYKFTNIVIHLCSGAAIIVLSNLLLIALDKTSATQRHFLALAIGAIWLLHPIHVSTTLYVVQRMTQLYTLFLLCATGLYVHLRIQIHSALQRNETISARLWLGLWLGCGALAGLAIGSKETAIIFPFLIVALDITVLAHLRWPHSRTKHAWRCCAIVLPLMALVFFTIKSWPDNQMRFVMQNFDLAERLMTQPRVLLDYVYKILIPRLNGLGLFHDDFAVSRSLFDPMSTIIAIGVIASALGLAVAFRKQYPVLAFGVLWFLGAHALEAGVLSIELYFEHRNYLPSFGLLFAVSVTLGQLLVRSRFLLIVTPAAVLLFLGALSVQNALSWTNPVRQAAIWASEHPDSFRARLQFAHLLRRAGSPKQGVKALDPSTFSKPDALYFISQAAVACLGKQQPDSSWATSAVAHVNPDRVWRWLPNQVEQIAFADQQGHCDTNEDDLIRVLDAHAELPVYARHRYTHYELHAVKQRILSGQERLKEAMGSAKLMIEIIPKPKAFLAKARLHTRMGELDNATETLRAGLARIEEMGTARASNLKPDFELELANITTIKKAIEEHHADNQRPERTDP